jgi:hypothetical protein
LQADNTPSISVALVGLRLGYLVESELVVPLLPDEVEPLEVDVFESLVPDF